MKQKGQVSLFIIIAIAIVAAALFIFFFLRPKIAVPSELQPVEQYLQDCVDLKVREAARIAGMQAGYLEMPEFEPGSAYMPFSNQLNFLGLAIPYWFYVSGNNIMKEQKPSLASIELQFENYLKKKIKECEFSALKERGYEIVVEAEPLVDVKIKPSTIETSVSWPLRYTLGEKSIIVSEHKIVTKSNFGLLYESASNIYDAEKRNLFLENYSIDILRLYAPVDGIELSCAPKVWSVEQIRKELKEAIAANIAMLRVKGSKYTITKKENKYFEIDAGKVSANVNMLYVPSWPSKIEVWPSENGLLRADPIGIQPGLEILSFAGFCYVPYHFVYDLYFPVLIQLTKENELFQFPVLVVIDKNIPRSSIGGESGDIIFDVCNYKTTNATIFSYDENNKPIEADIYFKCINQVCYLGKTKITKDKAKLETTLPKCLNAFIIAKASGHRDAKVMFTTTEEFILNIFLAPVHELTIEMPNLKKGEYAIVSFVSKDYSFSIYYPEQNKIELSEGNYNVTVYLFKESLITLGAQQIEKCIKMPASGIAGIFGQMQEQCYTLDVPQQSLTNVLFGGGKAQLAITESDLRGKTKLIITTESFAVPSTLAELTDAYTLIDTSEINIQLK